MPVPRHPIDLPPGDPKIDSQSLPVPLECTEQCQAPSIPNGEQSPNPIPVPGPALVPVPEHASDLHSRDPSSDPLSSSGLAPLLNGAVSQPMPELVIATHEPPTPSRTSSSLSRSSADSSVSKDSATPQATATTWGRACEECPCCSHQRS
ncbi:uncharacterized protein [Macrobrachium rosenbergii]|uniref:uncharacterized protein n=1 Tax=Macrobrachium rosenbergii TaxID=79674 RepID=UPI0034D632C2